MAALTDGQTSAFFFAEIVSGRTVSAEPFQWNGGGMAMVFVYLILLCLIGVGVFFMVRKYRPGLTKGAGNLSILESRMLGGRQFLVVGKYGEKTFLLGVCPGRIDYLCSLSDAPSEKSETAFGGILRDAEKKSEP